MDGSVLKYLKPTLTVLSAALGLVSTQVVSGQVAKEQQRTTQEPLYRVALKTNFVSDTDAIVENSAVSNSAPRPSVEKIARLDLDKMATVLKPELTKHPLDPALEYAKDKLKNLRETLHDYEAIMIKQERVNGELLPAEYMSIKVRNRRKFEDHSQPFSIYLKFLRPSAMKGREVIYVENENEGNLVAHETGFLNVLRVNLCPTGALAMRGNRYPITDAGIENLVEKLIERGQRDRAHGECDVEFFQDAKVLGRNCTMIQVKHDENKAPFDFHIGRIYIDDEHQVPIRYEAYTWPKEGEKELPLLESYTYAKLKINVGLDDEDFDPDNQGYDFP